MKRETRLLRPNTFIYGLILLCLALNFTFPSSAWGSGETDDLALLQKTSSAFTRIAKKTIPAVVFIKVEKSVESGQYMSPFEFNNPFDLFSDEFFERFFGRKYPHMQQPRQYKQMGQGSGFIISPDGFILTNNHVVGDADKITVQMSDGKEFKAEIIGTDPSSDVALIKIDGSNDLPVLPLGDSDTLEVGEWVMAIGNPFGLSHTMTVGVVSAKGRTGVGITDYEDFIQTDAAINPGNSGGPLINMKGEAIGINTAIYSRSGGYMGIGFAIPVNMVKAIKAQLVKSGNVTRGYLGVSIQDLSNELVDSFALKDNKGVLVADVVKESPADKAGMKRGDVIVEYNSKKIQDTGNFRNMVALTPPDTKVDIKIVRDGKEKKLTVIIEEQKKRLTKATQTEIMQKLGFSVQTLTEDIAKQLGLEPQKGVVVTEIVPGTAAQFVGLQPGNLIVEVNRKAIRDTDEFLEALNESLGSKRVLLLVKDRQSTRYVILALE